MKNRILILVSGLLCLAFAGTAVAHGSGYYGPHGGGLSGGVTIWSGPSYGPGYAASINYGPRYYAPAPRYAGTYFYPACGHWHPRGYRHAVKRGYRYGYAHGYSRGHVRHHKRHHRHHH